MKTGSCSACTTCATATIVAEVEQEDAPWKDGQDGPFMPGKEPASAKPNLDLDAQTDLLKRLTSRSELALAMVAERIEHLSNAVAVMKETFRATLKQMCDHGSSVTVAAGNLQQNRQLMFEGLPRTPKHTRQVADELLTFRNTLLSSVESNGRVLTATKEEIRPLHAAVIEGLRDSAAAIQTATEVMGRDGMQLNLAHTRGQISDGLSADLHRRLRSFLSSVKDGGLRLNTLAVEIRMGRESYRLAMGSNRQAIIKAMDSLKRDQEVLSEWSYDRVSNSRRHDRSFVLSVVEANGEALERVAEEYKSDAEIVRVAVQSSDGWALQFAGESLRSDRDIVMAAVRRSGWALEHASKEMRADRSIVLAAVEATGEALEFASTDLRADRELVLLALRRSGGWALQVAAEQLRSDRSVALEAVRQNGLLLEHVAEDLRGDREVVFEAVSKNGLALEHSTEELRADKEVVAAAVRSNPWSLKFAKGDAANSKSIILDAVTQDGLILKFCPRSFKSDQKVVFAAARECGEAIFPHVDAKLRSDPAILAIAKKADRDRETSDQGEGKSVLQRSTLAKKSRLAIAGDKDDGRTVSWTKGAHTL